MQSPVDPELNEYYLFHGTSPDAARAIANWDFLLFLSGTAAGSLYGKGLYFAESSAKSDEYTTRDEDLFSDSYGLRAILVCRILLGRVHYSEEAVPDVSWMVEKASATFSCFYAELT